jgi:hypothetical protein
VCRKASAATDAPVVVNHNRKLIEVAREVLQAEDVFQQLGHERPAGTARSRGPAWS